MRSLTFLAHQTKRGATAYQLTDRLHDGRTAQVPAEGGRAVAAADGLGVAGGVGCPQPDRRGTCTCGAERRLGGCAFDRGPLVR